MHGVPNQMPDAATEVQKKSERDPEKHNLADPGCDSVLHHAIGLWSRRSRHKPDDQRNGAATQGDARDPVENR